MLLCQTLKCSQVLLYVKSNEKRFEESSNFAHPMFTLTSSVMKDLMSIVKTQVVHKHKHFRSYNQVERKERTRFALNKPWDIFFGWLSVESFRFSEMMYSE